MEEVAALRHRLAGGRQRRGYVPLRAEFAARGAAVTFHTLFSIAVDRGDDGADQVAARLLVDLDPICPVSCRGALLTLAFGDWWLSDKLVPLYLVTQFGKGEVLRVTDELVAEAGLSGSQVTAVTGVAYWAKFPAIQLLTPFVSWESFVVEPGGAPDPEDG